MRPEIGFDVSTGLGEGALWDRRHDLLISVDIPTGCVLLSDPGDGSTRPVEVGQPVSAAMLRGEHDLLLATRDGFASLDLETDSMEQLVPVEVDIPTNRMNDAACDARGRCFAGTMAIDDTRGAGTLYRLDPDLSVQALRRGVSISNGIGWSPSGRAMYYIDTPTLGIDVYDYDEDTGMPSRCRRLLDTDPDWGLPDGLAVDAEGGIWVAFWDGAAVRRLDPAGAVTETIELPVARPTKPAFGGADLDQLYVTSAEGPIFVLEPGVRGLPANAFAG